MGKAELEILILVENKVYSSNLIAEHGLSFYLKYKGKKYLFDTGQGLAIINNARELNVDFNKLDGVFLSHGHYDHTGGLQKVLEVNPDLKVYGHPDIFRPMYSRRENYYKDVGFSMKREDIANFIPISKMTEIYSGIWLTGEIPGKIKPYSKFKTGSLSQLKDDYFKDDQSLVIETKKGLVVVLGCSHAGVINILKYINKKFADNIFAVIGGMHLKDMKKEKVEDIIDYLSDLDLKLLSPLHCTGIEVACQMQNRLGAKVKRASIGEKFVI